MAAGSLPQMTKWTLDVDEDANATLTTWWLTQTTDGPVEYRDVNGPNSPEDMAAFDTQQAMWAAYDAAKVSFASAGVTLPSEDTGERNGFLPEV